MKERMSVSEKQNNPAIHHSDLKKPSQMNTVMPTLTVASGVAPKRTPAKKRRPQRAKKPAVSAAAAQAATETPAVAIEQKAPTRLTLRSYGVEDDALIMRLTQEEIAPIYRASYGAELNMNNVMEYIQTSYTRIVVVEDEPAGYVSVMADDAGRMNVGTLVLAAPHQGKGYGKRIMRQLEHEAQALGMMEMETFIQATNAHGQAFAKSVGFTEVQGAGNPSQTVVMRKNLIPPMSTGGPALNTPSVPSSV